MERKWSRRLDRVDMQTLFPFLFSSASQPASRFSMLFIQLGRVAIFLHMQVISCENILPFSCLPSLQSTQKILCMYAKHDITNNVEGGVEEPQCLYDFCTKTSLQEGKHTHKPVIFQLVFSSFFLFPSDSPLWETRYLWLWRKKRTSRSWDRSE